MVKILRIQYLLLFTLTCTTYFANPIASIRLKQIIDSQKFLESFEPECQRFSKVKSLSIADQKFCRNSIIQLKKDIQQIHFKSNKIIQDIYKERQHLYVTQHKHSNVSTILQKLSDRFQNARTNEFNQLADRLTEFQNKIDKQLNQSLYTKQQTDQILKQKFTAISTAINQTSSFQNKQVILNYSKDIQLNLFPSYLQNFPLPQGKDLFNYILNSSVPDPIILLHSLQKATELLSPPKTYNKLQDITLDVSQKFQDKNSSKPKKVTVSSWRDPLLPAKSTSKNKISEIKSLKEQFSSIFSNQQKIESLTNQQFSLPAISTDYAYVQLPILLALHPEMIKYDSKTKRFISANPQNFVKDGFFEGFRKKFLRGDVDTDSFQQLSQLQALESARLIDIVNSQKQQKAIYRNIQNSIQKLISKHNLKTIFYDNLSTSTSVPSFNLKKIVVNTNINDYTQEALIALYVNSDQDVLEKLIHTLKQAGLIN